MMRIAIRTAISPDLALRDSADLFFDKIEATPHTAIVVDFKGVLSITRSFAHQYFLRRSRSLKQITEEYMPENIEKMFKVVHDAETAPKSRLIKAIASVTVI